MWEALLVVVALLFILAFLLAVCGLFTMDTPSYMPMSPDEEYEMLTGQYGLTDAEAAEIMDDSWRDRLK